MNKDRYSRRAAAALVLSSDAMGAALVAAAAEAAGFRPVFAKPDESLQETLQRTKPTHVLADGDDPEWRHATRLGPVMMLGARLFFFGSDRNEAELRTIAAVYQAHLILLPRDVTRFHEILARRPSPTPKLSPTD